MSGPPREDLPLPTQPPYTAFVGNLAFDLTEAELEDFFGSCKVGVHKPQCIYCDIHISSAQVRENNQG